MYPKHLKKLITALKRFPGVGSRSAERFAFHILNWRQEDREFIARLIETTDKHLQHCGCCGSLIDLADCPFCEATSRDSEKICIVATSREVFAIEDTREYKGLYHVLGGTLSPIEGRGPDQLRLAQLWPRLTEIKEVIIALDSTLEGDTTASYIKEKLSDLNIETSRLAFGLPAGCSLEGVDEGTLSRALTGRR
jgi:recombination protein RecR